MNEKSSEWKEYRIDELGQVVTGHTPLKSVKEYYESNDYTWIKPTDIRKGERYVSQTEEYYSRKAYEKYKTAFLPPLSTCVVTIGTVGEKICLTHKPCFTNQSINAIIPNREKFDPMFVYYLLKYNLDQVAQRNPGTASGRHHVSKSNISSIIVKAPLKPTQVKISSILAHYDDLLENNTRRIRILEEMAQVIYREWFVHFRFPGHEDVRMVESEIGMIPEGWEVWKLGDIAEEVRRSVEPNNLDPNTPYVGLEHIPRKSIALADWGLAKEVQSTKHQFFIKEILFGKIRPYFHKVVIAPIDGVCSSDAIVIRPIKPEFFALVLFYVSSEDFVNHATQTSQGTKMPRANWNVLVNYSVVIPPKPILEKFNRMVFDIVDILITKVFQNTNLRRTRDLLLPKLISGELDVSELDIMIPEAMT